MNKYIDLPNQELGFLRLATKNNYAYHLGNVKEAWMDDEFSKIKKSKSKAKTPKVKKLGKMRLKKK